MKIAIISLPLLYNYGGYLQCYALMETLRNMGHTPFYLQRDCGKPKSTGKKVLNGTKLLLEKIGLDYVVDIFERKTNTGLFYRTRKYREFSKKYIKDISPVLLTSQEVKDYCKSKHIEAYITGSDQIWRGAYSRSITDSFLGFAPEKSIKIAYAPSFGTDKWEYNEQETRQIEELLNTFVAISVREKDGIRLLKENVRLKTEPKVMLDPTFLLSKEHYCTIAGNTPKRNGVLTYILNKNDFKQNIIEEFCKQKDMKSFSVLNPKLSSDIIDGSQGYSVEQWLAGFRDADFVLTDSFHAIVFSLIFHKPFYVFQNDFRGNSRIENLLSMFQCENRLLKKLTNIDDTDIIDWDKIDCIKENRVRESLKYLETALQNDSNK